MPGLTNYPAGQRVPAPVIAGTTLQGRPLTVPGRTGVIVVVNVWASWCYPCRQEVPALSRLAREMGPAAVVVGINEQDTPQAARHFAATLAMAYPSLVDHDGHLLGRLTLLPPTAIPSTLMIDRRGRMAARIIGPATLAVLRKVVADLRAEG